MHIICLVAYCALGITGEERRGRTNVCECIALWCVCMCAYVSAVVIRGNHDSNYIYFKIIQFIIMFIIFNTEIPFISCIYALITQAKAQSTHDPLHSITRFNWEINFIVYKVSIYRFHIDLIEYLLSIRIKNCCSNLTYLCFLPLFVVSFDTSFLSLSPFSSVPVRIFKYEWKCLFCPFHCFYQSINFSHL